MCRKLNGKRFKVKDARVGVNLPPMHPFCRSTTIAVTKNSDELDRRIAELTDSTGTNVDFYTWRNSLQKLPNGKYQYVKPIDISNRSGIIKNIELPPETNEIRSMSRETKRLISEAFDKISLDYDVQIDEIVTEPLSLSERNVPFQFQPVRGKYGELIKRLVINSDYDFMGSQEQFQTRILKNFNKGVLASNNVEGLIAHEMAHVMTFQHVKTYSGYLIENKTIFKQYVGGVSGYADACGDGSECIAEAFSALRCKKSISVEAQALVDKYIERWRKNEK